jgi:hypothetical protein
MAMAQAAVPLLNVVILGSFMAYSTWEITRLNNSLNDDSDDSADNG